MRFIAEIAAVILHADIRNITTRVENSHLTDGDVSVTGLKVLDPLDNVLVWTVSRRKRRSILYLILITSNYLPQSLHEV